MDHEDKGQKNNVKNNSGTRELRRKKTMKAEGSEFEGYELFYPYLSKEEKKSLCQECIEKNWNPNKINCTKIFFEKLKDQGIGIEWDNNKLYFFIKFEENIDEIIKFHRNDFYFKKKKNENVVTVLSKKNEVTKALVKIVYLKEKFTQLLQNCFPTHEARIEQSFKKSHEQYRNKVNDFFFPFLENKSEVKGNNVDIVETRNNDLLKQKTDMQNEEDSNEIKLNELQINELNNDNNFQKNILHIFSNNATNDEINKALITLQSIHDGLETENNESLEDDVTVNQIKIQEINSNVHNVKNVNINESTDGSISLKFIQNKSGNASRNQNKTRNMSSSINQNKDQNNNQNFNLSTKQNINHNNSSSLNMSMNSDVNPNVNLNVSSSVHLNINSSLNPNANQNSSSNLNPNMNSSLNQNIISSLNQNILPILNQNMNQNMNSNLNQNMNSNLNQNTSSNLNWNAELNLNQNINSKFSSNINRNKNYANSKSNYSMLPTPYINTTTNIMENINTVSVSQMNEFNLSSTGQGTTNQCEKGSRKTRGKRISRRDESCDKGNVEGISTAQIRKKWRGKYKQRKSLQDTMSSTLQTNKEVIENIFLKTNNNLGDETNNGVYNENIDVNQALLECLEEQKKRRKSKEDRIREKENRRREKEEKKREREMKKMEKEEEKRKKKEEKKKVKEEILKKIKEEREKIKAKKKKLREDFRKTINEYKKQLKEQKYEARNYKKNREAYFNDYNNKVNSDSMNFAIRRTQTDALCNHANENQSSGHKQIIRKKTNINTDEYIEGKHYAKNSISMMAHTHRKGKDKQNQKEGGVNYYTCNEIEQKEFYGNDRKGRAELEKFYENKSNENEKTEKESPYIYKENTDMQNQEEIRQMTEYKDIDNNENTFAPRVTTFTFNMTNANAYVQNTNVINAIKEAKNISELSVEEKPFLVNGGGKGNVTKRKKRKNESLHKSNKTMVFDNANNINADVAYDEHFTNEFFKMNNLIKEKDTKIGTKKKRGQLMDEQTVMMKMQGAPHNTSSVNELNVPEKIKSKKDFLTKDSAEIRSIEINRVIKENSFGVETMDFNFLNSKKNKTETGQIKIPNNVLEKSLAQKIVVNKHEQEFKNGKTRKKISLFGSVKPVDIIKRGINPFPYLKEEEHLYTEVLVIGGGISGLAAAYYLKKCNAKVLLIEGRNRIGGRAFSTVLPQRLINNKILPETLIDLGANYLHCCDNDYVTNKKKGRRKKQKDMEQGNVAEKFKKGYIKKEELSQKTDFLNKIEIQKEATILSESLNETKEKFKRKEYVLKKGRRKRRRQKTIDREINKLETEMSDNLKLFKKECIKFLNEFKQMYFVPKNSNTDNCGDIEKKYSFIGKEKMHHSDCDYDLEKEMKNKKRLNLKKNMLFMIRNNIDNICNYYEVHFKSKKYGKENDEKKGNNVFDFLKAIDEDIYLQNTFSDCCNNILNLPNNNISKKKNRRMKAIVFSRDPRGRRDFDKSVTKLAERLKPKVSLVCGKDTWESTFYANWYNNENGKKIKNYNIYKVNLLCDKIRIRAARKMSNFLYILGNKPNTQLEYANENEVQEKKVKKGVANVTETGGGKVKGVLEKEIRTLKNGNVFDLEKFINVAQCKTGKDVNLNKLSTIIKNVQNGRNGNETMFFTENLLELANSEHFNSIITQDKINSFASMAHKGGNVMPVMPNSSDNHINSENYNINLNQNSNINNSDVNNNKDKNINDDNSDLNNNDIIYNNQKRGNTCSNTYINNKNAYFNALYDMDANANAGSNDTILGIEKNSDKNNTNFCSNAKENNFFINSNMSMSMNNGSIGRNSKKYKFTEKGSLSNNTLLNNATGNKKRCFSDMKLPTYDENAVIYANYYEYGDNYHEIVKEHYNDLEESKLSPNVCKTNLYDSNNNRRSMWDLLMECAKEIFEEMKISQKNFSIDEWKMLMVTLQSRYGYGSDLRSTSIAMTRISLANGTDMDLNIHYGNDKHINENMKFYDRLKKNEQTTNINYFKDNSSADRLVLDGWKWIINFLSENIQSNIFLNTVAQLVQVKDDDTNTSKIDSQHSIRSVNEQRKMETTYAEENRTNESHFIDKEGEKHGTEGIEDAEAVEEEEEEEIEEVVAEDGKEDEDNKESIKEVVNSYKTFCDNKNYNVLVKCKSYHMSNYKSKSFHGIVDVKNCNHVNINIHAKYVIVALPLGTLLNEENEKEESRRNNKKKEKITHLQFEPKLHPLKTRAMSHYKMGHHNKIILRFYPFDFAWPFETVQINCLDQKFQFLNLHAYGKEGCVLVHCFPPWSATYGYIKKEYFIVNECLYTLNKMFEKSGKKLPVLVDYIVTKWQDDDFSLGSYAYPSVDCNDNDLMYLRSPHPLNNPRVVFSGEYLSRSYFQCIDGAYDTGIRAAEDIAHVALKLKPPNVEHYTTDYATLPNDSCPFTNLPLPKMDSSLCGFYLTDGSDEALTDYESSEEEEEEERLSNIPIHYLKKEYDYLSSALTDLQLFFKELKVRGNINSNNYYCLEENFLGNKSIGKKGKMKQHLNKIPRNQFTGGDEDDVLSAMPTVSSEKSNLNSYSTFCEYQDEKHDVLVSPNEQTTLQKFQAHNKNNCMNEQFLKKFCNNLNFYSDNDIIKIKETFFYNYNKIDFNKDKKNKYINSDQIKFCLFNNFPAATKKYYKFLVFLLEQISLKIGQIEKFIAEDSPDFLNTINLPFLQMKQKRGMLLKSKKKDKGLNLVKMENEQSAKNETEKLSESTVIEVPDETNAVNDVEQEQQKREDQNEELDGKYEEQIKKQNDKSGDSMNEEIGKRAFNKNSVRHKKIEKREQRKSEKNKNQKYTILEIDNYYRKQNIYIQNRKINYLNDLLAYTFSHLDIYKEMQKGGKLNIHNYGDIKLSTTGFTFFLSCVLKNLLKEINWGLPNKNVDENLIIQLLFDYIYQILFYKHDFLCVNCLTGGDFIMCDFGSCTNVWHTHCLHLSAAEKKKELPRSWFCPSCTNVNKHVERNKQKPDEILQNYWRRRIYTSKLKFMLSKTRKVRRRLDALEKELSRRLF